MHRYEFQLSISQTKLLEYYRGKTLTVLARTDEGLSVRFPANLLVKHVAPDGVVGRFVLTTDANNKVVDLQRLSHP